MAQVERDDLWQAIYEASPYNWPMPCEHFAHRQQGGWDVCAECETDAIYEAVIKHMTESGRLLPPGGEVCDQFTVLEIDPEQRNGGMVIHWSLEDAEEWKTGFADDPGGYEGRPYRPGPFGIYRRQMRTWGDGSEHYTPWSPVVSDSTEGSADWERRPRGGDVGQTPPGGCANPPTSGE